MLSSRLLHRLVKKLCALTFVFVLDGCLICLFRNAEGFQSTNLSANLFVLFLLLFCLGITVTVFQDVSTLVRACVRDWFSQPAILRRRFWERIGRCCFLSVASVLALLGGGVAFCSEHTTLWGVAMIGGTCWAWSDYTRCTR